MHTRSRRQVRVGATAFCLFPTLLHLPALLSALPSGTCSSSSMSTCAVHARYVRVSRGPTVSYSTQQQASRVQQRFVPTRLLRALTLASLPLLRCCAGRLPVAMDTPPGQYGQPLVCLHHAHRRQQQQRRRGTVSWPFSARLASSALLHCIRCRHSNTALAGMRSVDTHYGRVAASLCGRRSRQGGASTSARRQVSFPASLASRCRARPLPSLCASSVPAGLLHSMGLRKPPAAHTGRAYRRQEARASERQRLSAFRPRCASFPRSAPCGLPVTISGPPLSPQYVCCPVYTRGEA